MAKARALRVVEAYPGSIAGTVTEVWEVIFVGPEIPNGTDLDYVTVENLDYSQPPAQLAQAVAASIRQRGASINRIVATNDCLLAQVIRA